MKKVDVITEYDESELKSRVDYLLKEIHEAGNDVIDVKLSTCSKSEYSITYTAFIIYEEKE